MALAKKKFRPKKAGYGLEVRTFVGKKNHVYTVFRTPTGSFHGLVEVEAKGAARDCGAKSGTTRQRWEKLWKEQDSSS